MEMHQKIVLSQSATRASELSILTFKRYYDDAQQAYLEAYWFELWVKPSGGN